MYRWNPCLGGIVVSFAFVACGSSDGDGTSSPADASADAPSDGKVVATDAPFDSGMDALADAPEDAPVDAVVDAPGEAAVDAALDAPSDPCTTCHGSSANAAPPVDTKGQTDPSLPSVGAHQRHLLGPSGLFHQVSCDDCHVVPSSAADPGHDDGLPAELTFGALATAGGVQASYSAGGCTVYCHGASLPGGSIAAPAWTLGSSQVTCGSCHGVPPPAPHPKTKKASCGPCHPFSGVYPKDPSTHIDGKLDVVPCGGCHAVPPKTAAHAKHYADSSSPPLSSYGDTRAAAELAPASNGYVFGCGNCHPLDEQKHADGMLQVELYDPGAPAGSLKQRMPASATYAGGKCADVYCHSSGQQSPSYVDTPAWQGGNFAVPRCIACHDNPPRYPSGGAGTPTANTHLVLASDGWELGHFGGLPGPWHTSYHGLSNVAASPITCQTCHYETVDPANTGPGGFYYLDTTGSYQLAGGKLGYDCTSCHDGSSGAPASGTGAVLPQRHVNGTRDVIFDPRQSLPASVTGLPAPPNRPTFPYWVTATPSSPPPGSKIDGTTWSLTLAGASYDASAKTCSAVPCHLKQSFGTGKPQYEPLTWGALPAGSCSGCHQF